MSAVLKSSKLKLQRAQVVRNFLDLPGCEFTRTQLKLTQDLQFDHWERIGSVLRSIEGSIQFWIGDWINFGENKWGEKYAQAVDATGLDYGTLANAVSVSKRIDPSLRNEKLSWSHHVAVAYLDDKEQKFWLDKAEAEHLPYRELRRMVEKEQRAKNFRLASSILEKVWERIQDGCYTAEAIAKCGECGNNIFGLELSELQLYMQQLVGSGKAEWRKQGGKKDNQRGDMLELCVPAGTPWGSDLDLGYRPKVEYGDDPEEHF
jgi:hypothetical protein